MSPILVGTLPPDPDPSQWWRDHRPSHMGVIQWFDSATGREVRNVPHHDDRGRCLHVDVEPVVSVFGEVVAGICRECDEQVPPPGGWT